MVKIMIADDQQLIRESLKIILDSDPNFEVVKVVGSGQEVLDTLETESIDIILMDVRMPSMSGVYSFGKKEVSKYKGHNINDF